MLFFGTIDEFRIKDTTTKASLVLNITSHWGNLVRQVVEQLQTTHKKDFSVVTKEWNFRLYLLEIFGGVENDERSFIPSRTKRLSNVYDLLIEFKEFDLKDAQLPDIDKDKLLIA